MSVRHFLSLTDLSSIEFRRIIARAIELKSELRQGIVHTILLNKTGVLVFEKSSTRTRVSFETGITQLGGNAIFLAPSDSQLSRGEPIEDTARVLSRFGNLIIMRTGAHQRVERMAEFATVPVINGLSDFNHPCQILADVQTFFEHRGDIKGHKIAWIGDGNNVCHSWMNAAVLLDFQLEIATPRGFEPQTDYFSPAEQDRHFTLSNDPKRAAQNASLVITDTWSGMGQESEKGEREHAFKGFCVDENIMSQAADSALFMHCLPAYRGYEVEAAVIDGPQSVVWDEAENRLHAQKALMEFLLTNS